MLISPDISNPQNGNLFSVVNVRIPIVPYDSVKLLFEKWDFAIFSHHNGNYEQPISCEKDK